MIDQNRLLAETFLKRIEWHDELSSTNTRALELSGDPSIQTPFIIGASKQSAGRGRGTNRWWGADGTLMFSVLFDMRELGLVQAEWPRFSLGVALAVAETIEAFVPHVRVGVKWPNDVWLSDKKVCGILIEQSEKCSSHLVVGIGLNVNTQFADAPEQLQAIATSLLSESNQFFDLSELLIRLLQRWETTIQAQKHKEWPLQSLWSRLCVLTGRSIRISTSTAETIGVCHGIEEDGALIVQQNGQLIRCYAGTVRVIE